MIKGKKASHVGVMLSIVVFITFLVFLYSIIEPALRSQRDKEVTLDQLETKLEDVFTGEITSMTILVDDLWIPTVPGTNCITIPHNLANTVGLNLLLKDRSENIIAGDISGTNFRINWGAGSVKFFQIYYTYDGTLNGVVPSSPVCETPIYDIGNVKSHDRIFEEKIIEIFQDQTSYDNFKNSIGLNSDFDFKYEDSDEILHDFSQTNLPETNIYIREVLVQYYNADAEIKSGKLILTVW